MTDKNQNLIPDRVDRVVLRVGALLTSGLGGVAAYLAAAGKPAPVGLGIALIVVPLILTYFAFRAGGEG